MNVSAIYHRPESNFCFATDTSHITLRLRFAAGEKLQGVYVLFNTKYEIALHQSKQQMSFRCSDGVFDYYQTTLCLSDPRFAYVFLIEAQGKQWYFCEDGLLEEYDFNFAYFNSFQYAYINDVDVTQNVSWLNNAVFYQIFVDRFCNSGRGNKSYVNAQWQDIPTPKSFYGGDLQGIYQHLPYIKSLGANALYLTPVFCSHSNHKYDIYDYFNVDKMFGGNDALKELVQRAHAMDIKVVLDGVFNHVGEHFAPFQDVVEKGKNSPYYGWFVIDGDQISANRNNYSVFAGCKYMPKLNTSNPEVQQFVCKVATHWITNYDVDGWRLDVSDEVSHDCWRALRKAVKSAKADAALIGENWHNSESYLAGDQLDSIMNYSFTKQMMDLFGEKQSPQVVANRLNGQLMRYTDVTNNMMFSLLDSHDTHRFLSLMEGNKHKVLAAIACQVFLQGSCCIYYGTELLTEGGYDPDCRRAFDWQKLDDPQVVQFSNATRQLLALKNQPAIAKGSISITAQKDELQITRNFCDQCLTLIVRLDGKFNKNSKTSISQQLFCVEGGLV